ncbi:rhodanese-like domain-containing protein [Actomonas aquatica]|uniref:Rhodanese-like domain-containing protein n=1 Tax=Actomonas aquatica TaxID=2866162 RepID=A0ABZ1C4N5_9BACT|nr:rhodanese-like domain-containing protein [Opitutus sp. WL0086]WRQ86342.1 rhodanese-like domain-containing protein [Opitutus sp. WL0086]
MDPVTITIVVIAVFVAFRLLGNLNAMKPQEAASLIESGQAVLIDVREPGEWAGGVAAPALLLSLSDLRGSRRQWTPALEKHKGKTLLLYCASGMRSGTAARQLMSEGHVAKNLGGFGRWARSGLPTRQPSAQELRA